MAEEMLDEMGVDMSEFMEPEAEEAEDGYQTEEAETEEAPEQDTAEQEGAEPQKAETEDLFELKYNKEIRKVSRDEVTTLAQKGMNYDKILEQRDTAARERDELRTIHAQNSKTMKALEAAARQSGMDIPTFIDTLRENMFVSDGMSRDAAKERLAREKSEEQLAEINRAREQQEVHNQAIRQRQERDIHDFIRKYPSVDPGDIPPDVWQAVQKGDTLVSAYGDYLLKQQNAEMEKLQNRIKALEQNKKNKAKDVGSASSDGSGKSRDSFLAHFLDD